MVTTIGTADRKMFAFWLAVRAARAAVLTVLATAAIVVLAPVALGWAPTVVLSGSMAPAIRPGDVVITSPVPPSQVAAVAPHSVVLAVDPAHNDGRLLLHRVVAQRLNGTLVTKGDANHESDSTPMPASHVRGLARVRVPLIGVPVWRAREGDPLPAIGMLGLVVTLLVVRPGGDRTRRRPALLPARHRHVPLHRRERWRRAQTIRHVY